MMGIGVAFRNIVDSIFFLSTFGFRIKIVCIKKISTFYYFCRNYLSEVGTARRGDIRKLTDVDYVGDVERTD